MDMTKTKILCTIGPATSTIDSILGLIDAGVDGFRLNFSHGSHEEHGRNIRTIRAACEKRGALLPILQDLCGPKLRIGDLEEPFSVTAGDTLVITTENILGRSGRVSTSYKALAEDVKPGDHILLDDGLIELEVVKTKERDVQCRVLAGGIIKPRKGMNLPRVAVSAPALTEKDLEDLMFGLSQGVDFVALSFVRSSGEICKLREIIREAGFSVPIIAKIEKPEAIEDLDGITDASDFIMVARGDLGVEMLTEDVPLLQKMIIRQCNLKNKPVITATQMLESMVHNPRPTRAEASDVANAVLDGTDTVMLSAETSVGEYPSLTVSIMNSIVRRAESQMKPMLRLRRADIKDEGREDLAHTVARAACMVAEDTAASAVFAITRTGRTAKLLSAYRIQAPIIAFSGSAQVVRELSLVWGVQGVLVEDMKDTDTTLEKIKTLVLDRGLVKKGQTVVFVAGIPLLETNRVNMIKVEEL